MSVSWDELKTHVLLGDSSQLGTAELVELIWRAMQPCNFIALAWMFAAKGEVVLWMHTLASALRVLKKPEWVREFATTYFTEENAATCHQDVQPHWHTMRLMFQVQMAYRSSSHEMRDHALTIIATTVGDSAQLLPLSIEESGKNPINGGHSNGSSQRRR